MAATFRAAASQQESENHRLLRSSPKIGSSTAELSSVLIGVAPTTARRLAAGATTIRAPRRTSIYTQGDKSTGLYVVISGMVKLSLSLPDLEERVIALHGPGAWFGEGALLLDQPHLVTATSLEDSKLAHIPSPAVLRCLRQDKTFALRLLAETLRRLRAAMLDSTAAGWSSARQRVIGFLLDKTATAQRLKDQITIELPAAKQVVASRLNLTPETLSRVFRELSRDGLVIVDGLRILIPSMGRLQAIHEEGDGVRKKGY